MTTAQERKQQERQVRRRRIQEAAREVFADKGYAKTSIEQVARRASLSVGAIYLYFRSKEDLYTSLLEDTLDVFHAELTRIRNRADLSEAERLRAAWDYLTHWAQTDVEGTRILRLISQPEVRNQLSDVVAEATSRGLTMIRDHLAGLITRGIETGAYRSVDAGQLADTLWALFLGALQAADARQNLGLTGPSFSDSVENAFSAIESSIRGMPAAPAAVAEAA